MTPLNATTLGWMTVSLLLLVRSSAFPAEAVPVEADDATFLHVLIVAGTDDEDVGAYVKIDANNVNMRMITEIPRHRRTITLLAGDQATAAEIEKYYRNLEVKPTDSVLCYYAGRVEGSDGERVLKLANGPPLKRSDLRKMMEAKGARLTVLLTEGCHEYRPLRVVIDGFWSGPIQASRYLFFRHRGVVDIHAASGTERAWGDKERGGLFTWALTDSLGLQNEVLDSDKDGIVTWEEFAALLARETELNFRALKHAHEDIDQASQTPQIYQLATPIPKPIPPSRWRLGINTFDTDGSGVRIADVFADTPAAWYGFKVDEILYRMATVHNAEETQTFAVRTERDFARVVDSDPDPKMLKCWLRDQASGESRSLYVRLCPPIPEASPRKTEAAAEPMMPKPPGRTKETAEVAGLNAFALDLYAKLREENAGEGLCLAPYSVSSAMAMVYVGARGDTAKEMQKALRFPDDPKQLAPTLAEIGKAGRSGPEAERPLLAANGLWVQKDFALLPEFTTTLREDFAAEVAQLDFEADPEAACKQINAWIAERTAEKVPQLFDRLTEITKVVVANAVYLQADWAAKFDKADTKSEPFHLTPQNTIDAPMMSKADPFFYLKGEGFQAIDMPYAKGDLSMLVFLPDALDGLAQLEESLSPDNLTAWLKQMKWENVELKLPRFEVRSGFTLNSTLTALGMPLAFSNSADFSGIENQSAEGLKLDLVAHEAVVQVDEEGTTAGGGTGAVLVPRSEAHEFRADHPFLFLIRDSRSGAIVFIGRVVRPQGPN